MDKNDGEGGGELAIATDEGDDRSERLDRLLPVTLFGVLMDRPKVIGEAGGDWIEQLIIGESGKRPESVMRLHPRRLKVERPEQLVPINRMTLSVKRGHLSNLKMDNCRRGGMVFSLSLSLKRGEMLTIFLPPLRLALVAKQC